MRRADAAEWILSLTTSQDRAASIAGDLAEQARLYGARWFWSSLIRTTGSLAWRAFTDAPLRLTGMAVMGALIQAIYTILLMLGIVFGHAAVMVVLGLGTEGTFLDLDSGPSMIPWQMESIVAFLLASFFLGKWLARKAPQRELAVYVTIWFIFHLVWIPGLLLGTGGAQVLPAVVPDVLMDIISTAVGGMCTLLGVKRVRRPPPALVR